MNRTSKIFLFIIILLVIALGYLTYKVIYFKDGYIQAATTLYEQITMLENSGIRFVNTDKGNLEIHIKESNNVIMDY